MKKLFQSFLYFSLVIIAGCASVPYWKGDTAISSTPPKGALFFKVVGEEELGSFRLNQPQGLVIDPSGNLYIVDSGNNRIVKCSSQGDFLKETGGFGWDNGEFNLPGYIAMDNGLSLYVADTQNKRVQRFDNYLNFVQSINTLLNGKPFENSQLKGVALSNNGELYLSDIENDCIWKLDPKFTLAVKLGGFEALNDPQGMSIDNQGNLYIADSGNNRIAVFDSFGNFLKELGRGYLDRPSGVEVGTDGIIYVANTFGDNLIALDGNGILLFKFGKSGKGEGEFLRPIDLRVYEKNKLYIVDSGNNRIQLLELIR